VSQRASGSAFATTIADLLVVRENNVDLSCWVRSRNCLASFEWNTDLPRVNSRVDLYRKLFDKQAREPTTLRLAE